jgi:nucleoside-diphosphate-sugar epimerase
VDETVLVTGATGFIGNALCSRLEANETKVIRMSRSLGQDVTSQAAFEPFLKSGVGTVYHLAARTFVPESWTDPASFYRVNTIGTQHALEFCRAVGARLFYLSAYVYGTPEYLPIDENHPVQPSNPYAHSKWLGEELCRYYFRTWNLPVTIVRAFNAYGPGQSSRFLVPSIVRQWVQGEVVRVANLAPKRDFVYLDDLVERCVYRDIEAEI